MRNLALPIAAFTALTPMTQVAPAGGLMEKMAIQNRHAETANQIPTVPLAVRETRQKLQRQEWTGSISKATKAQIHNQFEGRAGIVEPPIIQPENHHIGAKAKETSDETNHNTKVELSGARKRERLFHLVYGEVIGQIRDKVSFIKDAETLEPLIHDSVRNILRRKAEGINVDMIHEFEKDNAYSVVRKVKETVRKVLKSIRCDDQRKRDMERRAAREVKGFFPGLTEKETQWLIERNGQSSKKPNSDNKSPGTDSEILPERMAQLNAEAEREEELGKLAERQSGQIKMPPTEMDLLKTLYPEAFHVPEEEPTTSPQAGSIYMERMGRRA